MKKKSFVSLIPDVSEKDISISSPSTNFAYFLASSICSSFTVNHK